MAETGELLTVGDVARRLRVSRHSVYRRISQGELQAFRLGEAGQLRVPASAIEKLLRPVKERDE